jgi:hypothetical protein
MPTVGDIRMHYGRDGETYNGFIATNAPAADKGGIEHFSGYTFARMMSRLAKQIRLFPGDVGVVLSRKERLGTNYDLDKDTIQLLRDDPASAIRAMTPPDRTVKMSSVAAQKNIGASMGSRLRVGHDTLADAFGDDVYVLMDLARGVLECPVCGRLKGEFAEVSTHSAARMYGCLSCMNGFIVQVCGDTWATIRTEELIKAKADRLYLPRQWNKGGPWITRIDLTRKYRAFEKEREDV